MQNRRQLAGLALLRGKLESKGIPGGIRHYGGPREEDELFNTRHYDDVVQPLEIFKNDPLQFEPGTRQEYSTFGYNLLGCVVEGASGERYLEYMRRHVFEPAGMQHTRDDDPAAIVPWRADGYVRTDDGTLRNSRQLDMSSKLPAGGFITTAGVLYLLPERDFAVAILANLENVPERVPLAAEIARIVLDLKTTPPR